MSPIRARLLTLFLFVATATCTSRARADNVADMRFNEGLEFARAGKFEQARQAFLQAYALYQDPATLWNLAIAEMKTDHSVDALRHIKAYLKTPKPDPAYVSVAPSLIEKLNAKTGHVAVDAPQGADITVDGERVPDRTPLADVLDVSPGDHDVIAQIGTNTAREHVVVAAGQTVRVKLNFPSASAPTQPASPQTPQVAPPTEPPAEDDRTGGTIWKPMTFILGGVTLLAGGGALYFSAKSSDAKDRANGLAAEHAGAQCPAGSGGPTFCQDLRDARDEQGSAADAATVMAIGAGVLLAATGASAVLWLTRPSRGRSTAIIPLGGPSVGGFLFHARF